MKSKRPYIKLYFDELDALKSLSHAQLGQLLLLLADFECTGQFPTADDELYLPLYMMCLRRERDKKYDDYIHTVRSRAAKKRWENFHAQNRA